MDLERIDQLATPSGRDFPLVIASTPTDRLEKILALSFVGLLFLALGVIAPFANKQLARIDAFVPAVQSVMSVVDLITAALLLAQYWVIQRPAVLVLACGYVFSALFAFLQTLTFPGSYSAAGLFGDGTNTPAWLFVLWHTSFSISVICYSLLKDVDAPARGSPFLTVAWALGGVFVVAAVMTWAATAMLEYLPPVYVNTTLQTRVAVHLNLVLWSLSLAAFCLLFVRKRTSLDTWLLLVLIAWWPNFLVAIFFSVVRFSLGWYTTRFFSLIASSILLVALLAGTTVLYARLANAIYLLRRERSDRLMTLEAVAGCISHEIGQPLAAIAISNKAGLRLLEGKPVQLDKVALALATVANASKQAVEILEGIRRLFGRTAISQPTLQDVNDIVVEELKLQALGLKTNGVSVTTVLGDDLPQIQVDRIQIHQVLANLVKNAIEAMGSSSEKSRHLRVQTRLDKDSNVSVLIEDTGPGIDEENRQRMFQPFVTTKETGTGLGLPICLTIIENHGGKLRLADTSSGGSIFEILLPVHAPNDKTT